MTWSTIVAAAALGAMLTLGVTPAQAAPQGDDTVDPEIIAMLDEVPGGVIIDSTHAVWPALGMELSIRSASTRSVRSVGSCATDRLCAYSAGSLSGNKLTSACAASTRFPRRSSRNRSPTLVLAATLRHGTGAPPWPRSMREVGRTSALRSTTSAASSEPGRAPCRSVLRGLGSGSQRPGGHPTAGSSSSTTLLPRRRVRSRSVSSPRG